MNTLVIVLIAAVCLFGAYVLYGRWLANKWGIDPAAKTPAVVHEDGRDYVPTNGWTVFAHQFSSIAVCAKGVEGAGDHVRKGSDDDAAEQPAEQQEQLAAGLAYVLFDQQTCP